FPVTIYIERVWIEVLEDLRVSHSDLFEALEFLSWAGAEKNGGGIFYIELDHTVNVVLIHRGVMRFEKIRYIGYSFALFRRLGRRQRCKSSNEREHQTRFQRTVEYSHLVHVRPSFPHLTLTIRCAQAFGRTFRGSSCLRLRDCLPGNRILQFFFFLFGGEHR